MENNSKKQASKRTFNFSGLLAVILAVLLLAIVIPINLIVQYFDFKIDTTPSKMYTLTDKSIELLDSVKDKQIEELNARLAEVSSALVVAQQTAQAAQALHAGTIRQQLTDGEDDPNQQGQTVEQKKSWFSKVFGGR